MAAEKEKTKKKATPKKKATTKKKTAEKKDNFKAMLVKEDKLIPMDEAIKNGEITGKSIEHAEKMQKALSDDNAEEFFEAVDKFNEAENKKETLEVVNGDPAVLDEKEELKLKQELFKNIKKEKKVVEEKETGVKKIIKKINRSIGYFWNGQMIDF